MSDQEAQTPIFTKTHDFLAWLIPLTDHFPRSHRHTVTKRLLDAAFNWLERLIEANGLRGRERLRLLQAADSEMDKIRHYFRLIHQWRWINTGQYEHAGRLVAELGRLLGGWQKVTGQSAAG